MICTSCLLAKTISIKPKDDPNNLLATTHPSTTRGDMSFCWMYWLTCSMYDDNPLQSTVVQIAWLSRIIIQDEWIKHKLLMPCQVLCYQWEKKSDQHCHCCSKRSKCHHKIRHHCHQMAKGPCFIYWKPHFRRLFYRYTSWKSLNDPVFTSEQGTVQCKTSIIHLESRVFFALFMQ